MNGRGLQVEEHPRVDGADQEGPTLRTRGWLPGRIIWSADMMRLHFGAEMLYFFATKTVTADENGMVGIPVHPPIIPRGMYQNVPRPVADGAVIEHGRELVDALRKEIATPRADIRLEGSTRRPDEATR